MTQAISGEKIVLATYGNAGKRKTSVARAIIRPGAGRVLINGVPLEVWPYEMARWKMMEPLLLVGDLWKKIDVHVSVEGGGYMSQADAARIAIARGLLEYCNRSEELKKVFEDYDRYMLTGDPRRTESEKWGRYSARRRWQKSYR